MNNTKAMVQMEKIRGEIGYVSLYHRLKARLYKQNKLFGFIMTGIAPFYIFINLFFVLLFTYLTLQDPLRAIAFAFFVMAVVVIAVLIFATYIDLALGGSRDPKQYVKKIILWLLFSVEVPFHHKTGLNAQELAILKSVAQSEQSAADWRGIYVNIVVIGAVGFLWGVGSNLTEWFYQKWPVDFQVQSLLYLEPHFNVLLIAIGWGLVSVAVNFIATKLLGSLRNFLLSEFSSRAIIYACLEAEALLFRQKLESMEDGFSIFQKRSIAHQLGYILISDENKDWVSLSPAIETFHQDGKAWAVVNPDTDFVRKKAVV